jgi:N-acetylglucosaminyldiphosphoundecaprenol N-acetyl-beta-D-mannosaminyltransferase
MPLQQLPYFPLFSVGVHLAENYTQWLFERIQQNKGTQVVTLNAEMAMLSEKDPSLAEIINQAELVIPDGAGVVLYLRWRGQKQQRFPGIELAESLLEAIGSLPESYPLCFYGGQPGIAETAAKNWQAKIPSLSIITNHGYLNQEDQQQWLKTLTEKQPRLILVGLGVPRQEFWIKENRHLCPHATWIGVGGSFDIWAGTKTRAPAWLANNNLEWLYRLYKEPWRWRRMLALPQFFWLSLIIAVRAGEQGTGNGEQ